MLSWTIAVIAVVIVAVVSVLLRSRSTVSDAVIVRNIKAAFFSDANLRKYTIDIAAQNGIVTLVGVVNIDADKASAIRIAEEQQGVKQVVESLVLGGASPLTRMPSTGAESSTGTPPATSAAPRPAGAGVSNTIRVPANRPWSGTEIVLNVGDLVEISASGNVTMGGGPPMPPTGRPPNCGGRGGFPAGELPCLSLIGRIGERGTIFYVGSRVTFRAPESGQLFLGVNDNNLGDNSGAWTTTVTTQRGSVSGSAVTSPNAGLGRPNIVQAVVRNGETSLQLSPGRMYVYGMSTGGAAPSTPFAAGQYAQAVDEAGQLAAAIAYGANDQNSYMTQTGFHVIGGVSVAGSWDNFHAFYGSNQQDGASSASAQFIVSEASLVVVIGLGSSQQYIKVQGVPGLRTDALSSGEGAEAMIISHAYLPPGTYAVSQATRAVNGQDSEHMADLIGVFVFGSSQ